MKENNQMLKEFIITRFKISPHKLPFYFKWMKMFNHFAESNGSSDNIQEKLVVYEDFKCTNLNRK